jgi:hypothetical protein
VAFERVNLACYPPFLTSHAWRGSVQRDAQAVLVELIRVSRDTLSRFFSTSLGRPCGTRRRIILRLIAQLSKIEFAG